MIASSPSISCYVNEILRRFQRRRESNTKSACSFLCNLSLSLTIAFLLDSVWNHFPVLLGAAWCLVATLLSLLSVARGVLNLHQVRLDA